MAKAKLLQSLVGIIVSLVLAGCGGSVELLSNITEREANEVLGVLSDAGVKIQKTPGKDGAINLVVSQDQVARAIGLLSSEGLPRERRATMGDVFRKEGLISSPLEERARYLWALSQELSETLSQIDGVIRARVHVVLPERSTGGEPGLPSSAAVFVKHRRSVNLEESLPQIKRLVASSIPGLGVDKVSVVLVASGAAAAPNAAATPAAPVVPVAAAAASSAKKPTKSGQSPWLWVVYGSLGLVVVGGAALGGWRLLSTRRKAPASKAPAGKVPTGKVPVAKVPVAAAQ